MENSNDAKKTNQQPSQTVIVNNVNSNGNGNSMGVTGFVLALLGLVFCWAPVINWILWLLGLIFSLLGVFKPKKGLAIAGLAISFIGIIIMLCVIGAILSA